MVNHERTHEDDRDRLRLATMPGHYTDARVQSTMNAYTAMVRGELKADRIDTTAPPGETWGRNEPAAIRAAIRRALIGPGILDLDQPCPTCGAAPGTYCAETCRGFCGDRVHAYIASLELEFA